MEWEGREGLLRGVQRKERGEKGDEQREGGKGEGIGKGVNNEGNSAVVVLC